MDVENTESLLEVTKNWTGNVKLAHSVVLGKQQVQCNFQCFEWGLTILKSYS